MPISADLFIALKLLEVLRKADFQQIHFQDWRAHGFHCIQAKRTLGAFKNTLLTVTAHSSIEWVNEEMEQWNAHGTSGTKLFWCERYCVAHCDMLISLSEYMLEWLRKRGWKLPEKQRVVPNIFDDTGLAKASDMPADGVLAFLGELETRPGLNLFCRALNALAEADKASIRKILFVGTAGLVDGQSSASYINAHLGEFVGRYSLHTDLNYMEVQQLLSTEQALVCIPSLGGNLSYAVVECACRNIPLIASDIGGVAEIIPQQCLFAPTVKGLTDKLTARLRHHEPMPLPHYTAAHGRKGWQAITATAEPESVPRALSLQPLVTICMAHYNHGKYLPEALEALAKQSFGNFEVIITDDGSTDAFSQQIFGEIPKRYDSRFKFLHKAVV